MDFNKWVDVIKLAFLITLIWGTSCKGQIRNGPPVESIPRVAPNLKPAFPQQTRVAAVKTATKFKADIITDSLHLPWGFDFLPDGRIIVSEREGRIRLISKNGQVGAPLRGVPKVRFEAVSGMADVKIAPDFSTSGLVFWTYVEAVGTDKGVNCIARGKLASDGTSLEEVQVIYRTKAAYTDAYHTGSRMLFDPQGKLLVTFGDRYQDSVRIQAQDLNSPIGKIIRINPDGTPAAGNPYTTIDGALDEIWSIGHRNPQGLAFNPVSGELWESEHGPQSGDEVNVIKPGSNYGWPIISYGLEDNGKPVNGTGLTQQEGMQQPVYFWDPSVAPCGMSFYTGDLIPEWKNSLFLATLRGLHILRLVIDPKTNRIQGEERLLVDQTQRFRHIAQGPDDALYAITDQGRLYRIGR